MPGKNRGGVKRGTLSGYVQQVREHQEMKTIAEQLDFGFKITGAVVVKREMDDMYHVALPDRAGKHSWCIETFHSEAAAHQFAEKAMARREER